MKKPIIGITTGDPKGIGPEVTAKAMEDPELREEADYRLFGPENYSGTMSGAEAAQAALRGLDEACAAALRGEIDAIVTAPVNKARMSLAEPGFVGHTEFFQKRCGAKNVCMLFSARGWRVSLVTRHLPLRSVPGLLNGLDILETIRLTRSGLEKYFRKADPVIAVAGLNPHAGEDGLFGDEEKKIIAPAVAQARKEGIDARGPFAADTLFWQMTQGKYDAVVAMYHDQGLIPIKTLAFRDAVQVTLGLPFLRVSVDHGTAENLAGRDAADGHNMAAAIRLAIQMVC